MKKTVLVFLFILTSFIVFIFFAPTKNKVETVEIKCAENALLRNFIQKEYWAKWWPGKKLNDSVFIFKECSYTINTIRLYEVALTISDGKNIQKGSFQISALTDSTAGLIWIPQTKDKTGFTEKIKTTFIKSRIHENIVELLTAIRSYFSNPKNIYGFKVAITKVPNPHLISIKKQYPAYPTTAEIYLTINTLQSYAASKGAKQLNPAMLHTHKPDNINPYEVMIAVPIDIELKQQGEIVPKFMIQGALLEGEIIGGAYTVEESIKQFQFYLTDYKLSAPAIPYQSLITDRSMVSDTTKWVTKIYQPVFKKAVF